MLVHPLSSPKKTDISQTSQSQPLAKEVLLGTGQEIAG